MYWFKCDRGGRSEMVVMHSYIVCKMNMMRIYAEKMAI